MRRNPNAKPNPHRGRRGVAAVEFAVVAPLFLILTTGTIGALTLIHQQSVMTQAVREGGRLGAMDWTGTLAPGQTPNDKVIQDTRSLLNAAGIDTSAMTFTITHADGSKAGQPFELGDPANYRELFAVTATKPLGPADVFGSKLTGGRPLTAKAVFRAGRSTMTTN